MNLRMLHPLCIFLGASCKSVPPAATSLYGCAWELESHIWNTASAATSADMFPGADAELGVYVCQTFVSRRLPLMGIINDAAGSCQSMQSNAESGSPGKVP